MSRQSRRNLGRKVAKKNPTEMYRIIEDACAHYGDSLMQASLTALNRTFGFGPVRAERFIQAVNTIMSEEMTKPDEDSKGDMG